MVRAEKEKSPVKDPEEEGAPRIYEPKQIDDDEWHDSKDFKKKLEKIDEEKRKSMEEE